MTATAVAETPVREPASEIPRARAPKYLGWPVRVLSSFGLAMFSLGGMFVVTLLGTLAQEQVGLKAAIDKYFASWLFTEQIAGPLRIALPGGYLLMTLLGVNLLVGGLLRMRWDMRRFGILLTHLGIALLLIGGAVESLFKQDVNIALAEGETATEAQAYHDWEFAILHEIGPRRVQEWTIPAARLADLAPDGSLTVRDPELPFEVVLDHWLPNAMLDATGAAGPMAGGGGPLLRPLPRDKEPARNLPACRVRVRVAADDVRASRLWGRYEAPFTVVLGDETWGVMLRRQRFPVPFTLRLEDFHREVHPRTQQPRVFRSDVTLIGPDGSEHPRRIQMNDPMRWGGYVLYQESYGQRPDGETFSQFAVAKNPSDRWPILAVTIIGIGLIWHFAGLLIRHLGIEARTRRLTSRPLAAAADAGGTT